MKKYGWVLLCLTFLACSAQKSDDLREEIVDLTYPFDDQTVYWPTAHDFHLETEFQGVTPKGYYYEANRFSASEHGGTHLDAPVHFAEGKNAVDQIPLESLLAEGYLIDVSGKAFENPDHQVSVEDILEWEKSHGQIPDGSIVLIKTGYGRYWPDKEKYLGTVERGEGAVAKLHFPGLHPAAATWLMQNRHIKAVGIDTASIDFGQSKDFLTHRTLFESDVPALENVAHLDRLPQQGFTVIALPMKIGGGSGAPVRIIALIPQGN